MDWQTTCRVCLENGDAVSLFDYDENDQQFSEKYKFCCGLEILEDDVLPTLICLNCVDRLIESYKFKQLCLTSQKTLLECMEEFKGSIHSADDDTKDSDTTSIKQENGILYQYELPIEQDSEGQWTRTLVKTPNSAVVTKALCPKKRGRPRKYPNDQGQIDVSPYQRKKPKSQTPEPEAITTMLAKGSLEIKAEPLDDEGSLPEESYNCDDPDYDPNAELEAETVQPTTPRKRGRPRKAPLTNEEMSNEFLSNADSMSLDSEQIKKAKKKYVYGKTHKCETCDSSFTSNAALQAHVRRHLGIKPFVCSICGYACVLRMELRRHMLRHTGARPYKCRVCDRRFGDFGSRQKHERLHMGIRPYQCTLCGKSFTYSYVLANHMLTHTGEKKYSCEICNKKFTKGHHLKYHNKVHHKELYLQQQMELEAKKLRQHMNITGLSEVLSGKIVDGKLILSGDSLNGNQEALIIEEEDVDGDLKETDQAVADMQVVLDGDFYLEEAD